MISLHPTRFTCPTVFSSQVSLPTVSRPLHGKGTRLKRQEKCGPAGGGSDGGREALGRHQLASIRLGEGVAIRAQQTKVGLGYGLERGAKQLGKTRYNSVQVNCSIVFFHEVTMKTEFPFSSNEKMLLLVHASLTKYITLKNREGS